MNREVICFDAVAPARERGLKFSGTFFPFSYSRRSREGAWIEIPLAQAQKMSGLGRSREGAWIEIL